MSPVSPSFSRESKCLMNFRVKIPHFWPLTFGSISSSHGVQIVPDSPTNQSWDLKICLDTNSAAASDGEKTMGEASDAWEDTPFSTFRIRNEPLHCIEIGPILGFQQ